MLKIKNYTPSNDVRSSVVATVDFYITDWGLHLNCCRYIRKKNGGFFVGFPSYNKDKDNPTPQYEPFYAFDKDKNDRFQSAAQRAINEWINTQQGNK